MKIKILLNDDYRLVLWFLEMRNVQIAIEGTGLRNFYVLPDRLNTIWYFVVFELVCPSINYPNLEKN